MTPVLITHIAAGSLGLISGTAALSVRKGERLHRAFGTVFFLSMLTMAALGAYVAAQIPIRGTVGSAFLTFYLVATGWMTVKRKAGSVGLFEYGALLFALGTAAMFVFFGLQAANSPTGRLDAIPAGALYFFACVAVFAATLDLKLILRGGISGAQRIARHLWRMCAALLIAAVSFFIGQQKVMPAWMHGSPLLYLPEIAVLGLMSFWMIRVRLTNWFTPTAVERRTP